MKSLFAEYIKERCGKEIFETDKGFITFYAVDGGMYIEDLFIKPEFRQSREASKLADAVAMVAKERGFKKLFGSVMPSANSSTDSLMICIRYGFKLLKASDNAIWLVKEL